MVIKFPTEAYTIWYYQISSIFDKRSMLEQTPYIQNKSFFNEFVANVLRDHIGSKKNQPPASEKRGRFLVLNIKNLGSG